MPNYIASNLRKFPCGLKLRKHAWPRPHIVLVLGAVMVLGCFGATTSRAQTPPPDITKSRPLGFGWNRPSLESLYAAARPPELTYTNAVYGISFRFPSNFVLHLGDGERGIYSSKNDPDKILLVTDEIPSEFWMGTNAAAIMLFVDVQPNLSVESCSALAEPDEWTSGETLKLQVDGVELKGRTEIQKGNGRGIQSGVGNIYRRQYTGYAHGICYEFDIDMATFDQTRIRPPQGIIQVDPERIFAELESTILAVKFERPNSSALGTEAKKGRVTKPWETNLRIPKDIAGLEKLADWDIRYPAGASQARSQYRVCGTTEVGNFLAITFWYGSALDAAAANAAVDKMNADVIELLKKNGWNLHRSPPGAGVADCYAKELTFAEFGKGTSRCTMNSPCNTYDEFSFTVYVPITVPDMAQ
jgi:hypothetical protein